MKDFFAELKRRNVYKVAVAYAVVAWLLIQACVDSVPDLRSAGWVMKVLSRLCSSGFRSRSFWPGRSS